MYRTVIWSTDGSEGADGALAHARMLADLCGARIVAVHCDQRMFPAAEGGGTRLRIARTVDTLRRDGLDIELIVRHSRSEAADVVAALAGELGADLIVCGTRGLDELAGTFLGSFTYRLLHVATCPVLAVLERAPVAEPEIAARSLAARRERALLPTAVRCP